jgi:hypothetical protein
MQGFSIIFFKNGLALGSNIKDNIEPYFFHTFAKLKKLKHHKPLFNVRGQKKLINNNGFLFWNSK